MISISMAGKKSKDKGKGYEREVAKFLSDMYGESFIRTFTSGAFVGGQNASRKSTLSMGQIRSNKSDIIPPDEWNNFAVECKFYKEWPFHQLFTGDLALLDEWIDQLEQTSDRDDLKIIFMKFNRKGQWVCFPAGLDFLVDRSVDYKGWKFCSWEQFWQHGNAEKFKDYSINGVQS